MATGSGQYQHGANSMTFSDSGNWATYISRLQTNMQSGKLIYASDIALLNQLVSDMAGHYHTYTDYYQVGGSMPAGATAAGFGNLDSAHGQNTNNYTTTENSSGPGVGSASASPSSGGQITAAFYNSMASIVNGLRSHSHTITDQTSA
jgi:hypothetical protein